MTAFTRPGNCLAPGILLEIARSYIIIVHSRGGSGGPESDPATVAAS
jgi:hypothetical protein